MFISESPHPPGSKEIPGNKVFLKGCFSDTGREGKKSYYWSAGSSSYKSSSIGSKKNNNSVHISSFIFKGNQNLNLRQIPNSTSDRKVLLMSFHLNGQTVGQTQMPEQHNKQHHRKVMPDKLSFECYTLGFHPQTQKLESPCTA